MKKRVKIFGALLEPVVVGKPAVIKEAIGVRHTSTVLHVLNHPTGVIEIETKNTWYELHLI